MAGKIKVIVKRPDESVGHKELVDNTLKALQGLVGGYIETLPIGGKNILICNDEGKIRNMEPNIKIFFGSDTVHGTVVIAGEDGEEFGDVRMGLTAWGRLLKRWGN